MSWIVEQSDEASAVTVNGNTITCTKEGYYGSPINVLYKDPADRTGDYFWEIEVQQSDNQGGSYVSVGVTNDSSFKSGWGLKAMKYLGNLSDGSGLLVQRFGEPIKQGDKVGILLRLSDADLKLFLFHNERPLGLAFHFQAPFPKPLYPVVSFDCNARVKISRSQRLPTALDRSSTQFAGVEGHWRIAEYSVHPQCVGVQLEIKRGDGGDHSYRLHARVVNNMNCGLEQNPSTKQWKTTPVASTMMAGPPAEMQKEQMIGNFISGIQKLDLDGQQSLLVRTNNGEQVQLQRFAPAAPAAVTNNIFQ